MELSMEIKQVQRLSPQMIQSMEILQMGTQELQEYVEKALLENPVLEGEVQRERGEDRELLRKLEWLNANDHQNRWYHREDAAEDWISNVADTSGENLYDYLRSQLDLRRLPPDLRRGVECVLTGLNANGYLEETAGELAARCGQSPEVIAQAEALVRGLEPAGVGARTLSECLALQLERRGEDGLAMTIVRSYLEDMARSHYHRISRETGASREEIQRACCEIRALEPRPGAAYSTGESPRYITPDVVVTELEGQLVVTVSDHTVPELKVSSYYQQLLQNTEETQVKDYLADKVRQACWVVKGIEQRRGTLLSCAQTIARRQEDFFLRGGHLHPLTLADVAGDLNIHESTVSRAAKDKYLQCARGLYPLSYFFSRALPSGGGEGVSPERAKTAIRTLIDGEDRRKPLSDQKLCDLLGKQGLLLSRRTIAKYRDEMGIASTSGRKEF